VYTHEHILIHARAHMNIHARIMAGHVHACTHIHPGYIMCVMQRERERDKDTQTHTNTYRHMTFNEVE